MGWYVRPMPHMLRPSDSPQLSERSAYQARSEFCGAPHRQAPQAARSESAGTQVAGSPFLGLLSFGEAKESKSAVGPRPDFLPHHKHTAPTGNNKAPIPAFPQRGKELNPPHPSPLPQAGEGVSSKFIASSACCMGAGGIFHSEILRLMHPQLPSTCAEARSLWGGMCGPCRTCFVHLTRRSCLSEALTKRVASSAAHPTGKHRRLPGAKAQGRR